MKLSGVFFQNTRKNFKLNLALVLVLKLKLSIEQLGVYIFIRLWWFRVKATTKRTNFQPIKNSEGVVCTQPWTKSVLFRTALYDCNGGRMHLQLAFVIKRRRDITLPWQQNFWITTIGSLSKDDGDGDGDGNEYRKKQYRKIPKISPRAYIFQRPFLRGLYSEGLIYGEKFAFQNRLGQPYSWK